MITFVLNFGPPITLIVSKFTMVMEKIPNNIRFFELGCAAGKIQTIFGLHRANFQDEERSPEEKSQCKYSKFTMQPGYVTKTNTNKYNKTRTVY